MPGKLISLFTLDKLIISESPATSGEHQSLDFIPGSTLLGAVASKLYTTFRDQQDQWLVFHSGKIRFGNAYPTNAAAQPAWPMPLCYHYIKNTEPVENGKLSNVFNLSSLVEEQQTGQRKQMRSGYITNQKYITNALASFQLKSAINYATGTAKESQLFGYSTLENNQWFCGEITWDEDLERNHPEILAKVLQTLSDSNIRIGRSKSAEFGRIRVQLTDLPQQSIGQIPTGNTIHIFCLSDVLLRTEQGEPLLTIPPKLIGLEGIAELNVSCSFVRTRRYSPYNAARRAYDQERVVIGKGSVFTFRVKNGNNTQTQALKLALAQGIGLYREMGLGQIRLALQPPVSQNPDLPVEKHSPVVATSSVLLKWLDHKTGQASQLQQAEVAAKSLYLDLLDQYLTGRSMAAVDNHDIWGPTKSAWSQVLDAAKTAGSDEKFFEQMFTDDKALIASNRGGRIKTGDPWQSELVDAEGHFQTMADWLHQKLSAIQLSKVISIRLVLQIVARRAMSEQPEFGVEVNDKGVSQA